MISNNSVKKINSIIFSLNRNIFKPKLWHIDTDVYLTWIRFFENFKRTNIDADSISKIKIVPLLGIGQDNLEKKFYSVYILDKNVTPRKNGTTWSWSALRQFLQIGSALGFFPLDNNIKEKNFTSETNVNFSIEMNHFLKYGDHVLKEMFFNTIINAFNTNVSYISNFGFNLFINMLLSIDKNVFSRLTPFDLREIKNKNSLGTFMSNDSAKVNEYFENFDKNGPMYSYWTTVEKILTLDTFDNIISKLWNATIRDEDDYILRYENIIKRIASKRSGFKAKVIQSRENGVSDLVSISKRMEYSFPIDLIEAAHIYPVYKIRNKAIEFLNKNKDDKEIESLLCDISNTNNALLLKCQMHTFFDRNLINFDIFGKLIIVDENAEIIRELGIPADGLMIRPEIFTDEMKDFFKRR